MSPDFYHDRDVSVETRPFGADPRAGRDNDLGKKPPQLTLPVPVSAVRGDVVIDHVDTGRRFPLPASDVAVPALRGGVSRSVETTLRFSHNDARDNAVDDDLSSVTDPRDLLHKARTRFEEAVDRLRIRQDELSHIGAGKTQEKRDLKAKIEVLKDRIWELGSLLSGHPSSIKRVREVLQSLSFGRDYRGKTPAELKLDADIHIRGKKAERVVAEDSLLDVLGDFDHGSIRIGTHRLPADAAYHMVKYGHGGADSYDARLFELFTKGGSGDKPAHVSKITRKYAHNFNGT